MHNGFNTVSVIGLGYIGLPTAAMMSSHGVKVIGVDVNSVAVDTINGGGIHIVEPDLNDLVQRVVRDGNLVAQLKPSAADAFVIAVPTPTDDDHRPDVTYVMTAVRSIAPVLTKGNLVILESTCPVGTTESIAALLAELGPDLTFPGPGFEDADVCIAYCPERVLPGRILIELAQNDRSIGGLSDLCSERASALYRIFVRGDCIRTDARTAELVKLTENAFRDVNIAFANELSLVCDKLGVDVWRLIELANRHPRVNILQPGAGVGGHCIAVDPWFIVHAAPEVTPLMRTARNVNDAKPHWVVDQVRAAAAGRTDPKVVCLGLAYKPDVDDLRESPALEIAIELGRLYGERLMVVEPNVSTLPDSLARLGVRLSDTETAIDQGDLIVALVGHREFHGVPSSRLAGKAIVDAIGLWRAAPAARP